jgi:hypothetical protein
VTTQINLPAIYSGSLNQANQRDAISPYSRITPLWNETFSMEASADESLAVTPIEISSLTPPLGGTAGPTTGYDTTINAATDRQAHEFWAAVAQSVSQQTIQSLYATNTWAVSVTENVMPNSTTVAVWSTLLMKLSDYHTSREPEQQDIVNVISNSLFARDRENYISPKNLLRACAVGASLSQALTESPHIYAAPGGRIVLDYPLSEGRFTAVVTSDYVHLLGDLHGEFRDRTITNEKYDLLELKEWVGAP